MFLRCAPFWFSLFGGKMLTLEICRNGLLKNYKCALFCGLLWRELSFSWESLKEAGRRRYGPLSKPKQFILPYVYLGMDGISCRLIKGDYREGGNGGLCWVKEEVLQIQSCCRRPEQHVAVAKGLCINSLAILHGSPGGGVEVLDTSWGLGIGAERLLLVPRRHPGSPSAWAMCALGSNLGFLGLSWTAWGLGPGKAAEGWRVGGLSLCQLKITHRQRIPKKIHVQQLLKSLLCNWFPRLPASRSMGICIQPIFFPQ